jgi:cell division protein FtsI (penicillin-binding protein 3)
MAAKSSTNTRLYYLAGFLAFWFLLICVRLVWLQVIAYGDYTQKAARQQQRSIEVAPVRGNIYDRNGNELAMTIAVDSVFAVPSEVPDIHSTSVMLARILKTDALEIESHMRASRAFAWVARKIDPATSARIRAMNLRGIYLQKESKRFYPKRELAAQVLGYVGLDDEGLGGVEREFDKQLTGKPGKMLISMDAKRRWFGRVEREPDSGENLVLTLDEKIQYIAERELHKAIGDTHAEAGTIVVENPHTGEVLALANWPDFDPNSFNHASPSSLKNRAVSDIYEPGSTFKVVTLSAALEEKLTNPDEVIDCQMGSIVVSGRLIHDHKAYGALTVTQVLENSSDVGAIKLALRLGDERFDRYIRAFGFGSQTGIELPGETRGLTKPASRWSKVSIGAISMGQEIGVSPMQLIAMASTIANDGVAVAPRILAGNTPPHSTPQLVAYHPVVGRRVISPLTAARLKHMLEGVVLHGTGPKAILNGYTSAGKTGTAQKTDPATGRYSKSHYIASFTGFAPVNNPAYSVLVVLDSPVGPHQGGEVAAPVFARVMQQVLAYMNVPHDVELQDARRAQLIAKARNADLSEGSPDYIATAVPETDSTSVQQRAQATPERVPTPTKAAAQEISNAPAQQTPSRPSSPASTPEVVAASEPPSHGTVVLNTGDTVVVPDFRGKPLRTALDEADSAGIELEISGSGVGRDQSPEPGSRISPGGRVSVRFGH